MRRNQFNYDEIQDQHLDTMIKLAFMQADALEAQEIVSECENGECSIDEGHAKATYDLFLHKLAKREAQEKKQSRAAQVRRSIPRLIEIAACLVLILGIAAPFAVANVESIRVKVMELLISIQDDHTELQFVENDEKAFDVPADWQGLYYPSYIPDGFVLDDIGRYYSDVTYINEEGAMIYFNEYTQDDFVDVNSEDAVLSYELINGERALVAEQASYVIVTWAAEDRYFVVDADTTKDEALAIARSVRKIR